MDNADKQRHATQSNPAHTKLHLVLKLLLPLRCIATRLMESIRSCAVKLTVVLAFAGAMPSLGWAEKDPQERVSGNQKQTRSQLEVNNLFGSHTPVTLKVIPGRQKDIDELDGPAIPAKVCISGRANSCYVAQAAKTNFARNPRISLLTIEGNYAVVLLSASYLRINDEWKLVTLLGQSRDGKLTNLLPSLVFTLQGDIRIWRDEQISASPLLTATDYYWTAMPPEETHFSDHHYRISTYKFCAERKRYLRVDDFITPKKFPGLDDENHPGEIVLKAEMAHVRKRLLQHQAIVKSSC
jgi:hypothetical protein